MIHKLGLSSNENNQLSKLKASTASKYSFCTLYKSGAESGSCINSRCNYKHFLYAPRRMTRCHVDANSNHMQQGLEKKLMWVMCIHRLCIMQGLWIIVCIFSGNISVKWCLEWFFSLYNNLMGWNPHSTFSTPIRVPHSCFYTFIKISWLDWAVSSCLHLCKEQTTYD